MVPPCHLSAPNTSKAESHAQRCALQSQAGRAQTNCSSVWGTSHIRAYARSGSGKSPPRPQLQMNNTLHVVWCLLRSRCNLPDSLHWSSQCRLMMILLPEYALWGQAPCSCASSPSSELHSCRRTWTCSSVASTSASERDHCLTACACALGPGSMAMVLRNTVHQSIAKDNPNSGDNSASGGEVS